MNKKSNPLNKMPTIAAEGKFAAVRKFDIHTGIDLYCQDGDEVFAIEDGVVLDAGLFTGGEESPWWNDTDYVGILGKSGYIIYGEVNVSVKVGSNVRSGQLIANVKKVLKKEKGTPTSMLHLELYESKTQPVIWKINEEKPEGLLDPSGLINTVKGS